MEKFYCRLMPLFLVITSCSSSSFSGSSAKKAADSKPKPIPAAAEKPQVIEEIKLKSLKVTPENAVLQLGDTVNFQVEAIYSNETKKDLTLEAEWKSSDAGLKVELVSDKSVATATGSSIGKFVVTVAKDGITAQAPVEVKPIPCKTLYEGSLTIYARNMNYYMYVGGGNGWGPVPMVAQNVSAGNVIYATGFAGGMWWGNNATFYCPAMMSVQEVAPNGSVVQSVDLASLANGLVVKGNDSRLFSGGQDDPKWYTDNSGSCTFQIKLLDRVCPLPE